MAPDSSILAKQLALKSELLGLPMPPESAKFEHAGAEFASAMAELMVDDPFAGGIGSQRLVSDVQRIETDHDRRRILMAMLENHLAALKDPLNTRTVEETFAGTERESSISKLALGMKAVWRYLEAIRLYRLEGSPSGVRRSDEQLRSRYGSNPLSLQAGLLVALHDDRIKAVAAEYVSTLFPDCDVNADISVLQAYFQTTTFELPEMQEAFQRLGSWKSDRRRTVSQVLTAEGIAAEGES